MFFLFTRVILRFHVSFSGCKVIQTNFVFVSFSAGNKTSMPKCHHARCGECTYPSVHLDYWWLRRFLIPSLIKTIPYSTIHYIFFFLWQYGGFLKWWYPTTMGFPTKNDQLWGCFGVPPFKETPIYLHAHKKCRTAAINHPRFGFSCSCARCRFELLLESGILIQWLFPGSLNRW